MLLCPVSLQNLEKEIAKAKQVVKSSSKSENGLTAKGQTSAKEVKADTAAMTGARRFPDLAALLI